MLAALAVALALASTASAELGRVVTLGDSAATGTGLGPDLPGTPDVCNRTDKSYSALAMQQVVHREFVNEACDGATTYSLFQGWTEQNIRAQFEVLNGEEDAVILTIGNNNSLFGEIASNCLMHPDQWDVDVCTDTYVVEGENTLLAMAAGVATSTTPPSVGTAIDQIHTTSPGATVFLVGYPRLTPPDGAGCKPNYFNLTPTDGPVFGAWETAMNDTLRDIAAAHDAYFVDNNPATLLHSACTPAGVRFSLPFSFLDPTAEGEGVPFHTNIAGATTVANTLLDAMAAAGLDIEPVDTTGPAVTIASPISGANLTTSPAQLIYSATDDVGVDHCDIPNNSPIALTVGENAITVTCWDTANNSGSSSVNITYSLPQPPPTIPAPTPAPAPAPAPATPRVSKMTPSVIRQVSKQRGFVGTGERAGGASIRVELDAAAVVWIRLERTVAGRRSGGKCVPQSRSNRRQSSCTLWAGATTQLRMPLPQGSTSLHISGNHRGRKLASGLYRVSVALDSTRATAVRSAPFRIRH